MAARMESGINGLLEAALVRPQTGYYADLIEEAAALWESLSQNHAFLDGNKRTAFAANYTLLAINAVRLTADAQETYVSSRPSKQPTSLPSTAWSHGCAVM
jgi:death-on-curing family protein